MDIQLPKTNSSIFWMQTKNIGAQCALFINLNTVVGILFDNYLRYFTFFLRMCNSPRLTSTECRTPIGKFFKMVLFCSSVGTFSLVLWITIQKFSCAFSSFILQKKCELLEQYRSSNETCHSAHLCADPMCNNSNLDRDDWVKNGERRRQNEP